MDFYKINAFKYFVKQLCILRKEIKFDAPFSRTQLLKLLFFVSAIKVNGQDLLDIFNSFYAMQFGPVESDVLNAMNSVGIDVSHIQLDETTMKRIDASISELNSISPSLFKKSASELVEITHKWSCWKDSFAFAEFIGKGSAKMSVELIRQSNQVFE